MSKKTTSHQDQEHALERRTRRGGKALAVAIVVVCGLSVSSVQAKRKVSVRSAPRPAIDDRQPLLIGADNDSNIAVGGVVAGVLAGELAVFSAVFSYLSGVAEGGPVLRDPNWEAYTGNYVSPPDTCTNCPYVTDLEIEQMMDILDDETRDDSLLRAQEFADRYRDTVDYTLQRTDLTDDQRQLAADSLDVQEFNIRRTGEGRTSKSDADVALQDVLSEELGKNTVRRDILRHSER